MQFFLMRPTSCYLSMILFGSFFSFLRPPYENIQNLYLLLLAMSPLSFVSKIYFPSYIFPSKIFKIPLVSYSIFDKSIFSSLRSIMLMSCNNFSLYSLLVAFLPLAQPFKVQLKFLRLFTHLSTVLFPRMLHQVAFAMLSKSGLLNHHDLK